MKFYQRHLGDYARDAGHLSLLEHGVYTRLLDVYYGREGGIPDDQVIRLAGARSASERAAVKAVLAEFFELQDGAWRNARCEAEIDRYRQFVEEQQRKGRASGAARRIKSATEPSVNNGSTVVQPRFDSGSTEAEPEGNLPIPNTQYPSTNTHNGKSSPSLRSGAPVADAPQAAEDGAVRRVFDHWKTEHRHARAVLDEKRRKLIRERLKAYNEADLCQAISGYKSSPHHQGQNDNGVIYDDIELLLRDAKHVDAGIKLYREPPRADLSLQTRRIVSQTENWQPPEVRRVAG